LRWSPREAESSLTKFDAQGWSGTLKNPLGGRSLKVPREVHGVTERPQKKTTTREEEKEKKEIKKILKPGSGQGADEKSNPPQHRTFAGVERTNGGTNLIKPAFSDAQPRRKKGISKFSRGGVSYWGCREGGQKSGARLS